MGPSGVVRPGIHPHRVIAGLEGLDASTMERPVKSAVRIRKNLCCYPDFRRKRSLCRSVFCLKIRDTAGWTAKQQSAEDIFSGTKIRGIRRAAERSRLSGDTEPVTVIG